jgi:glycosyltransferase involved in cell wall biosynthesis
VTETPELVSIVIACHNYGRYVGEAIESALGQTYQPVEVIVVDDGSTDNSVEVARRYAVQVLTQQNSGVCVTGNRGIRASRGAYVLRLDADDRLDPAYVEETLSAIKEHPGTDFAYTEVAYFGSENGSYPAEDFDAETLTERNYIHASALMSRDAFDTVGGYDLGMRTSRYEDWDLWLRFVERGMRGIRVPGARLQYRRHPAASRSTKDFRTIRGAAREIKLASQLQDNHPTLFTQRRLLLRLARLPGRVIRRKVSPRFAVLSVGFSTVMLMRSLLGLARRPLQSRMDPLSDTRITAS